jgi:hypothetical protein
MDRSEFDIKSTLTTILAGMTKSIPVACTLGATGLAAQARRWEQLMARALTGRDETPDGLRLSFRPEAEDELRALVAVETGCCAWATWTVEPAAGAVVLDVRSADEGVTTLRSMFTAGRSAGRTSAPSPGRGHRESRR